MNDDNRKWYLVGLLDECVNKFFFRVNRIIKVDLICSEAIKFEMIDSEGKEISTWEFHYKNDEEWYLSRIS